MPQWSSKASIGITAIARNAEARDDAGGRRERVRQSRRDPADKDNRAGVQRFRAIGRTAGGRLAFIVFTMRIQTGQRIRPISAHFMHTKEVKPYEKAYPDI